MQIYQYPYNFRSKHQYGKLELELHLFLHNHPPEEGGLGSIGHFKEVSKILWPEKSKCHFAWHPWAEWMLEKAVSEKYLGIIGCASSGKTDFAAIWAIINWLCAPTETMVLVTSTSLKDSRKRIWGSITKYFQGSEIRLPGKLVDSMGIIRTERGTGNYNDKEGIALIAGEKKKERESIGKMIGLKNNRVILIADELPELSEAILEAGFTNLNANPHFQLIGIGNFASMYDPLGVFVAPASGYGSITPNDVEWETRPNPGGSEVGVCIRCDGLKSPNIVDGEDRWPMIYNSKTLSRHRSALGENTIGFWRMVRSFPCPEGTADTIYSEPDLIQGKATEQTVWLEPPVRVAGFDPAFTVGGDDAVLYIGSYGLDINRTWIIQFDEFFVLREDITKRNRPRNYQIADQFASRCVKAGVKPEHAGMDVSGAGAAMWDIVTEVWSKRVLPVQFGGAASSRRISLNDQRLCSEHYANRVSELWFAGLEFIRYGQLKGVGYDLARQMKARRYEHIKGSTMRVRVESKVDMKARVGWSPDIADAAFVLIETCRTRLNAIAGTISRGYVQANATLDEQVRASGAVYENANYSTNTIELYAGAYESQ